MVQEKDPNADLNIGCSNITKLQLSNPAAIPEIRQYQRRPVYADISSHERMATALHEDIMPQRKFADYPTIAGGREGGEEGRGLELEHQQKQLSHSSLHHASYDFLDSLNRSFLPGLGLGILVTSIVVLIWGATRLRQNGQHSHSTSNNNNNNSRPSTPTATTCYAASEHIARLADPENGTRYLKLQATTSL